MTTHFRTCPLCEAMCGLEIETDGARVTRVRGDRADVWSKGFLCTKGAALGSCTTTPTASGCRWSATATSGTRSVARGIRPLRGVADPGGGRARHGRGHRLHG
jgi:hypothetical protein